jgi:hypothetical protein
MTINDFMFGLVQIVTSAHTASLHRQKTLTRLQPEQPSLDQLASVQ